MNHDRSKSRRFCSYKDCSSDRLTTYDGAITFFSFPKDTERCSTWITNSGREEFRYLTPRELSEKKVCELHFHPCMFSNNFRTNLKKNAIPLRWNNSTPELIQIDDDDDDDDNDENEIITETINVDEEIREVEEEIEHVNISSNISNSALTDKQPVVLNGESNEEPSQKSNPVEVVLTNNNCKPSIASQATLAVASSTTTTEENCSSSIEKSHLEPNSSPKTKTKFHNLPPQTTQGEFYYQQCASAEETNNSYPEPPEGEMPLFVQQNSVVSLADDVGHSEESEPLPKRRKRDKEDDLSDQMKDAMKHLKNITALLTTTEDEFELFGKSVALQLKKMSLCTAISVQAKIQQLLSEHRISDIKKEEKGKTKDTGIEKNDSAEEKVDEEEKDNLENQDSPQLSLDCVSETSENEVNEGDK